MSTTSAKASWPPHQDNRRQHERTFEPGRQLRLVVDDGTLLSAKHVTENWSAGGCLVYGPPDWQVGETITGMLESRQGSPAINVTATILRIDEDGRAALQFTKVEPISK